MEKARRHITEAQTGASGTYKRHSTKGNTPKEESKGRHVIQLISTEEIHRGEPSDYVFDEGRYFIADAPNCYGFAAFDPIAVGHSGVS